jgi:hypothetical protein
LNFISGFTFFAFFSLWKIKHREAGEQQGKEEKEEEGVLVYILAFLRITKEQKVDCKNREITATIYSLSHKRTRPLRSVVRQLVFCLIKRSLD